MSVAEAAHRPAGSGRALKLTLAFLILIAGALALAWYGAGSLRPEVTSSGLEFRTVKAGKGDLIGPNDLAGIEYVATTDDGSVLDSSNGPQPFASSMPGLFPGFAEAMGKMQEGGQYHFTMPKALTHSAAPPGPPPGANLKGPPAALRRPGRQGRARRRGDDEPDAGRRRRRAAAAAISPSRAPLLRAARPSSPPAAG